MKVFDDHSKTVLLRAGLYLGECFARLPGFRWTTGNVEYMQMHMPVVAGFRNAEELPPLVVAKNLFSRIVANNAATSIIDSTISVWQECMPKT
jgi:hypothetical protein